MNTLLVAAVEAELGELPGEALGVGALVAGVRASALLARRHPDALVLVGSAGAYPGGPAVGEVVAAQRLGWARGAADVGAGYVPLPPPDLHSDGPLLDRLGLPRADVLTTVAITTDPALVSRRAASWAVEHLETYGVAQACQQHGVPFVAILGIANRVGPDAHAEWKAHRSRAEQAARDAARALLG